MVESGDDKMIAFLLPSSYHPQKNATILRVQYYHFDANMVGKNANMVEQHGRFSLLVLRL